MGNKILYIENNQQIPALKYLDETEQQPLNYRIATEEEFEFYKHKLDIVYIATNSKDDPSKIDYNLLGLFKKRYFNDGELNKTEYYINYNPNTNVYDDLAVVEHRTFYRNAEGYVMYRILRIEWFMTDGSIGIFKESIKYYDMILSMSEGVTKRTNIIDQVKADLLVNLMIINGYSIVQAENEAKVLLSEQANNMILYREGDKQPLVDGLVISEIPLLDYLLPNDNTKTIRDWIIETIY